MEPDPKPRWRAQYSSLRPDLMNAVLGRHVFRRMMQAAAENPALDHEDPTFEFVESWYYHAAALVIRRHVRPQGDSLCLLSLLEQVATRPEVLGLSAADADYLVAKLKAHAMPIIEYADRAVAHLDKRGLPVPATVGQLDSALDAMTEVFSRCEHIILDKEPPNPEVILGSFWGNALDIAWCGNDAA